MRKIQVVGTNGKGSVCTYLANILTAAGYKTGLYTSPHVLHKEERISIDGKQISPEDFLRLLGGKEPEEKVFLKYTDACMAYFEEQGVEIAVLETGLGGRLDPVSRYDVDETVLTAIGMDHTDLLGDTIEQIAMEKCATINYQGYVVSMPQVQAVRRIIEVTSELQNARLLFIEPEEFVLHEDGSFDYQEFTYLRTNMRGGCAAAKRGDSGGGGAGAFARGYFCHAGAGSPGHRGDHRARPAAVPRGMGHAGGRRA